MTRAGHHGMHVAMDAGVATGAGFGRRAWGSVRAVRGKFNELTNRTPTHPGWRIRNARKLWAKIQAGALGAEAEAGVRRDYAVEFRRLGLVGPQGHKGHRGGAA